jgi:hypothetical protein
MVADQLACQSKTVPCLQKKQLSHDKSSRQQPLALVGSIRTRAKELMQREK